MSYRILPLKGPVRIVILDGFTMNPGDLSWNELAQYGELVVYERSSKEEVLPRTRGFHVAVTNKESFQRAAMVQLPELRLIAITATGSDRIDLTAARELGIVVSNVPAYSTDSVAEMVFALILASFRRVELHAELVRAGEWTKSPDFCFWKTPQRELAGATLGVVGWGAIGRRVGAIGRAFGMRILVTTRTPRPHESAEADVQFVGLGELVKSADIVTLHCPLTPDTQRFINADVLRQMRNDALLVNTSRGGLVDELALAQALRKGSIGGAILDVVADEPMPADHPLRLAPNCLITPHIAWATMEARGRLMKETVANVRDFLQGTPRNVLS